MIIILWRKRLTEKYARRVKAESQRVKGGGTPLGLRRENNLINGGSDGMGSDWRGSRGTRWLFIAEIGGAVRDRVFPIPCDIEYPSTLSPFSDSSTRCGIISAALLA